jgi:hypothetical protein
MECRCSQRNVIGSGQRPRPFIVRARTDEISSETKVFSDKEDGPRELLSGSSSCGEALRLRENRRTASEIAKNVVGQPEIKPQLNGVDVAFSGGRQMLESQDGLLKMRDCLDIRGASTCLVGGES